MKLWVKIALFNVIIIAFLGTLVGLAIRSIVTTSMRAELTRQGKSIAKNLSNIISDSILLNDVFKTEGAIEDVFQEEDDVEYIFVTDENGQPFAHTFQNGLPSDALNWNPLVDESLSVQLLDTEKGLIRDIGVKLFQGMPFELHIGMKEERVSETLRRIRDAIVILTLVLTFVGSFLSLFLSSYITKPLNTLVNFADNLANGKFDDRIEIDSKDEVGTLAKTFNHMIGRIADYTGRLEEQTMELERAHQQTRTVCSIVQEIGALRSINEISSFLIHTFKSILKCEQMVLLLFSANQDTLFALSVEGTKALSNHKATETAAAVLENLTKVTFIKPKVFKPPLVPDHFQTAARNAIVPVRHEGRPLGALVIACTGECKCNVKEVEVVAMMLDQAAGVIRRALSQEEEVRNLQLRLETAEEFSGIIGKDPKMQVIYKLIEDTAPTDATVLVHGESGTGKELVARAIHELSPRQDRPFVVINCSAYPATLLESELFGHEKGAFTGAIRQKSGRFERAHGGTVFLDEIGEIPPSAQIKLLRILQTRKVERLGGEKSLTVDVRVLAATNRDLLREVKKGNYREDLYYRLKVVPIHLPPLRKRRNDIPLLARHFLRRFAAEQDKDIQEFSPAAMRLLLRYSWPGNVRELENSIEHAMVLAKKGRIEASDLPDLVDDAASSDLFQAGMLPTMVEHEIRLLQEVLEECDWNKKEAARRLGIGRTTLYGKLKKYQISKPTKH
jgi:two-component system response regulator HydG